MVVDYNTCKLCLHSEYKGDALWICTKHEKECDELWDTKFDCKDKEEL
ncbi:hypothetical protein UT300009_30270 [Paraclostridium bifermentans]